MEHYCCENKMQYSMKNDYYIPERYYVFHLFVMQNKEVVDSGIEAPYCPWCCAKCNKRTGQIESLYQQLKTYTHEQTDAILPFTFKRLEID